MSKDKCCGNCKYLINENIDFGWCNIESAEVGVEYSCHKHVPNHNGWTEITPENVDEVDCMPRELIVIGWIKKSKMNVMGLNTFWFTLKSMAMQGGFYYYVLPELKIE